MPADRSGLARVLLHPLQGDPMRRWKPLTLIFVAAVALTSCEMLFPPEPEISLAPPSWIQGTWENESTGDIMRFTSSDVILNGTSVRSWATNNEQSVADRSSTDPSDSRFSNWYAYASGDPGSDFENSYQFSMYEWEEAPGQAVVMVQPGFANLQTSEFVQTSLVGTTGWADSVVAGYITSDDGYFGQRVSNLSVGQVDILLTGWPSDLSF